MIYHPNILKSAQRNKIVRWTTWYHVADVPKTEHVLSVWWEWNGSALGQYDLFWYVGSKEFDYENRIAGGIHTMKFGNDFGKMLKTAYQLQKTLEQHFPTYTPLPIKYHKQAS
jgi:hypothetical protein